jgi:hypothetical protein
MLGHLPDNLRRSVGLYLESVYVPHSGYRAHRRIPIPDLLSTFTALWTLWQLGQFSFMDFDCLVRAISMLRCPTGGFCASAMDLLSSNFNETLTDNSAADVEYTFYGLGSLSILHLMQRSRLTDNPLPQSNAEGQLA